MIVTRAQTPVNWRRVRFVIIVAVGTGVLIAILAILGAFGSQHAWRAVGRRGLGLLSGPLGQHLRPRSAPQPV